MWLFYEQNFFIASLVIVCDVLCAWRCERFEWVVCTFHNYNGALTDCKYVTWKMLTLAFVMLESGSGIWHITCDQNRRPNPVFRCEKNCVMCMRRGFFILYIYHNFYKYVVLIVCSSKWPASSETLMYILYLWNKPVSIVLNDSSHCRLTAVFVFYPAWEFLIAKFHFISDILVWIWSEWKKLCIS